MWFGGWEETLCPVKAPANIVSLAAGENCGREYGGKKLEEVQEGEERKTLSQKKSVEKKKLSIWKKKTFMGRWRDINMHHILVRYSCLGSWELLHYFATKTKLSQKELFQAEFLWIWFFLHFMRIFIFSLWGPLRKDRKIVFASGSTKISRKKPAQHIFTGMKIRFHQ